ncbi:MAG: TIR domain-containing protein [Candidatus Hydrogenedentes bacterium]|nr:TIR domain-containing protein [Candidatus Hydrogenedentota bacterium]
MTTTFQYDVFLSHNSKDKPRVRRLAERLRDAALRVWFDEWIIRPGDDIYLAIERGLEASRTLILCMSPNAFGSDWVTLERSTVLFRDPSNISRRFIPLLLTDCKLPDALRRYKYVDYGDEAHAAFDQLLDGCRPPTEAEAVSDTPPPANRPRSTAGVAREIGFRPASANGANAVGPVDISVARLRTTDVGVVGREAELGLLDGYWENPNTNVVSIVGFAGCGKSALVNQWLINMGVENFRGAERVYGWTFDGQRSVDLHDGRRDEDDRSVSADDFMDTALGWFGYNSPTINSLWDKGERLARLFRQSRTLLILDGLESLQHPTGLGSEGTLTDPALRVLLSELAVSNPGLCVITTRAPVADLASRAQSTAPQVALQQLPTKAAILLLRQLGVRGSEVDLEVAANEVHCHALTLRLLGTYLRFACGGDVSHRSLVGMSRHQSVEVIARQVVQAYERWFGEGDEVAILRILGLFDEPAFPRMLEALSNPSPIPTLTDALPGLPQWRTAVVRLRDCGLLAPANPDDPDTLDAHPLVKVHFRERLRESFPDAWQKGNERLYLFLRDSVDPLPDRLQPLLRLYAAIVHGCRADRHQDALDAVYKKRISRGENFARNKLGAVSSDLRALECFIQEPWSAATPSLHASDQAFVLSNVGLVLKILGRSSEAIQALQAGRNQYLNIGDSQGAAFATRHLSLVRMLQGELVEALNLLRELEDSAGSGTPLFERLATTAILADLSYKLGDSEQAWQYFRSAEEFQKRLDPEAPALYSIQGYKYCEFLLSLGRVADANQRALDLAKYPRQQKYMVAVALNSLLLGRVEIAKSDSTGTAIPPQTDSYIEKGVEGLRCAGEVEQIIVGLLTRAELYRRRRDLSRSTKDLVEVGELVERTGMRLYLPDLHLEWARFHVAAHAQTGFCEDISKAAEHLRKARELVEEMRYGAKNNQILALERSVQALARETAQDEANHSPQSVSLSPSMDTITNDKLVDMSPRWATFRGFSLLFDNPTQNISHGDQVAKLSLRVAASKELDLYRAFSESVREMADNTLTSEFMLCLLPASTYHVTLWNGVNDANLTAISAKDFTALQDMLAGLPDSIARDERVLTAIQKSPLVTWRGWSVDFVFDKLDVWHRRVLVARLRPENTQSQALLEELLRKARGLSDSVGRILGMDLSQRVSPHVTVGYYGNENRAKNSLRELDRWNSVFCRNSGEAMMTFRSVGLYAFTDMVSYFRRPDP